ncbi:hypothetical protein F5Y15DRAFT_414586 [Xylariaceae sp. FL0016]|nr:hypothetical protein F5Y15DRAFT_414586 [Xylariaceae sp. FL0016]
MKFTTAFPAFLATALAIPTPQTVNPRDDPQYTETISISSFSVHEALTTSANGSTVATPDGADFLLTGHNATDLSCSGSFSGGLPTEVIACGDSPYSFALYPGATSGSFALRLYHALGVATGYYGEGEVPVYCHAGGGSALSCAQVVTPVNITIDSLP